MYGIDGPIIKCEPTGGNLKWGTIIPLIGGSSIGCSISAGNLPAFHLTYTPFKSNETHLERYWPGVPKYYIDKSQEPENFEGKSVESNTTNCINVLLGPCLQFLGEQ